MLLFLGAMFLSLDLSKNGLFPTNMMHMAHSTRTFLYIFLSEPLNKRTSVQTEPAEIFQRSSIIVDLP